MIKNYDSSKATYTETDGDNKLFKGKLSFRKKQKVFTMIMILSMLNEDQAHRFTLSKNRVRMYIKYYSEIIDEAIQNNTSITNSTPLNKAFNEKSLVKSILIIKEAYRNFEQERLLKLLPAKQDEAPIKTRKKI